MIDKLKLKSSHEVIDTVNVADVDSIFQGKPTDPDILTVVMKDGTRLYCDEICPVDSLQEEPVNYNKLNAMLNDVLSKETKESWNERLGEETVSDELEKAAVEAFKQIVDTDKNNFLEIFKAGAKWQEEKDDEEKVLIYKHGFEDCKEQMTKDIWKPADGDDLPEIDREVIALLDNGKVVFAHRPPEYWDGKNIITGKVTRNYPKTYGKGGWNIPDVKYWLDVDLSNNED